MRKSQVREVDPRIGFVARSAPGESPSHGGGSTWITGSYDPDLDLVTIDSEFGLHPLVNAVIIEWVTRRHLIVPDHLAGLDR
jgi:hypothetical protein